MKKNQVNAILIDQTNRRKHIINYVIVIGVVIVLAIAFFGLYVSHTQEHYVSYNENSNLDYQVHLKENEFFRDDYLGSNNQYIATLIDYINADFNYNISLDEQNISYRYSYRIDAEVIVKEKNTGYIIYNFKDNILEENDLVSSNSNLNINENIDIDYNYYNNLINKFVKVYNLDNANSSLEVKMYVDVIGSCEEFEEDSYNESVITLSIPLTTKTMAIDINHDLNESQDNVMACKNESNYPYVFLFVSILLIVVVILIVIKLFKYIIMTRTAETIYDREMKKILNNYRSYIQKINNEFDLTGYQVLTVDTFNDMLEIRDTIQEPILMVENKEKTGTFFLIPSKTKILYLYALKVKDIKKQMKKNALDKKM